MLNKGDFMKDNETLVKRIKSNKTLQKEMLKYNSKQWENVLIICSVCYANVYRVYFYND